jgi:hypothetical protein
MLYFNARLRKIGAASGAAVGASANG